MEKNIVIVGNGIAGVTAARHIRKLSNHIITIISSESAHFFSRPALMYVYMGHMQWKDIEPFESDFWTKNRIICVHKKVNTINSESNLVLLDDGSTISYDVLILATGSKTIRLNCPGEELNGVCALYSKQDLEKIESLSSTSSTAVITGGGLIGIELAEMLRSRNINVVFLIRENYYWNNILPMEESEMINRHIKDHHIDLRLNTELSSIHGDENGNVSYIITNKKEKIDCQFVGITIGVRPNIEICKSSTIETNKGILVNEYLQTNIPNIYAIGDCAELRNPNQGRRPIEAVWYTGRMMGETLAHTICIKSITYKPALWFNSAKFLDIEYQVYGHVPAQTNLDYSSIYCGHTDGRKSLRIVYETESKNVVGFNVMGYRFRHEVCEKWILDKTQLENVVENIGLAIFDPEFFSPVYEHLQFAYTSKFEVAINVKKNLNLRDITKFLKTSQ